MIDSFIFKNSNNHSKHLCMVMDNMGCDLHVLKRLFRDYNTNSDSDSNSDNSSIDSDDEKISRQCIPTSLTKK